MSQTENICQLSQIKFKFTLHVYHIIVYRTQKFIKIMDNLSEHIQTISDLQKQSECKEFLSHVGFLYGSKTVSPEKIMQIISKICLKFLTSFYPESSLL